MNNQRQPQGRFSIVNGLPPWIGAGRYIGPWAGPATGSATALLADGAIAQFIDWETLYLYRHLSSPDSITPHSGAH